MRKCRRPFAVSGSRRQTGQAIVEYVVVLAFGVILLLKPFSLNDVTSPSATPTQQPALKQLANAIKDYHKHYTYAMAISSIPDCDYQFAYDKSASAGDIGTLTGNVAVGFDRCIDWNDPQIPGLSVTGDLAVSLTANVQTAIQNMVTDMINDSISQFTNPSQLLGDMLTSFNPF